MNDKLIMLYSSAEYIFEFISILLIQNLSETGVHDVLEETCHFFTLKLQYEEDQSKCVFQSILGFQENTLTLFTEILANVSKKDISKLSKSFKKYVSLKYRICL